MSAKTIRSSAYRWRDLSSTRSGNTRRLLPIDRAACTVPKPRTDARRCVSLTLTRVIIKNRKNTNTNIINYYYLLRNYTLGQVEVVTMMDGWMDRILIIVVFIIVHDATNGYVKCFVFIEITMFNETETHARKISNRRPPPFTPRPPPMANVRNQRLSPSPPPNTRSFFYYNNIILDNIVIIIIHCKIVTILSDES